jgi:hypothetical protein
MNMTALLLHELCGGGGGGGGLEGGYVRKGGGGGNHCDLWLLVCVSVVHLLYSHYTARCCLDPSCTLSVSDAHVVPLGD